MPEHLRTIVDPSTEEDDVARKQLQAKKDYYDALEAEIKGGYERTLKKQLSAYVPCSCRHISSRLQCVRPC